MFTLEIKLARTERALERLLSTIGRRGYEVTAFHSELSEHGAQHKVVCLIETVRSPEVLKNHIAKLRDVLQISVCP